MSITLHWLKGWIGPFSERLSEQVSEEHIQFITLYHGDVIYTGTSGKTSPIGDVVEMEIEGIGILKNRVA